MPNPCCVADELSVLDLEQWPGLWGTVGSDLEGRIWWFSVKAVFFGHHED